MIYQLLKCILSQRTDLFNGKTKYYLKIYTFNMTLYDLSLQVVFQITNVDCKLVMNG